MNLNNLTDKEFLTGTKEILSYQGINPYEYMSEYYLEPNQDVLDKFLKVREEFLEVSEEIYKETKSELAQEILDLILASKNLLKKLEREGKVDIGTETFKHSLKLNKYLESGKYKK
ncbi:MAG: MazG nucleotide pyrophosphohydrolase domain-containing protein [Paraclostridium sp.]